MDSPKSPGRGVWNFVKRNVWSDAPSHPINDCGSEANASSDKTSPERSASSEGRQHNQDRASHSPFQSHANADALYEEPDDVQQHGAPHQAETDMNIPMASEPSLRHGLSGLSKGTLHELVESGRFVSTLYSVLSFCSRGQAARSPPHRGHQSSSVLSSRHRQDKL